MRKYFGVAAVVVFLMAFALALWGGPNKGFLESPFSSIPTLHVDYSDNGTEIYIQGLNDFEYTNMSLHAANDTMSFGTTKNNAHILYYVTSMENFTMNITVWNGKKEYAFNGSIRVEPAEAWPKVLTLLEEKKDKIQTISINSASLPWKKLMERIR
jgi:hypothetical protein